MTPRTSSKTTAPKPRATAKTTTAKKAAATSASPAKRAYNSSRRKRQAAETRAEVLDAAVRLFNESGWAGTTVAAIADAAGVAVETVYSGFGSKKALLRDAADASAVGDADPVPFVERREFLQLGEGTVADRLRAGVDVIANTHDRSAGVWRALQDAAEGDEELAAWALDAEQRRRVDTVRSLELVFGRPIDGSVIDVLWVLYGPETYRKLVYELRHSRAEYQRCIAEATLRMLGEDVSLLDAVVS
jgi:AcrR family transcriptional regulator